MKRFITLIESIQSLSQIDIERIKQDDFEGLQAIKELEDLFEEFYSCGYENATNMNIDECIDFQNRLCNLYSDYDRP